MVSGSVLTVFMACRTSTGLALEPLSGAIAAGNAVVLKPSELAPSTAAFLAANIPRYLDSRAVKVVLGGPNVGEELMEHRWDKVLFTGSTNSIACKITSNLFLFSPFFRRKSYVNLVVLNAYLMVVSWV